MMPYSLHARLTHSLASLSEKGGEEMLHRSGPGSRPLTNGLTAGVSIEGDVDDLMISDVQSKMHTCRLLIASKNNLLLKRDFPRPTGGDPGSGTGPRGGAARREHERNRPAVRRRPTARTGDNRDARHDSGAPRTGGLAAAHRGDADG